MSRPARLTAGALVAAAVLGGCGGGEPTAVDGQPAAGAAVSVRLSDFAIALEPAEAPTGPVTIAVTNEGSVAHALAVIGPDGGQTATDTLEPGESAELAAALPVEGAVLYCPVDGHRGRGMELRVHGGAGTDTTETPAPSGTPSDRY